MLDDTIRSSLRYVADQVISRRARLDRHPLRWLDVLQWMRGSPSAAVAQPDPT
jgi:hypothetical protein